MISLTGEYALRALIHLARHRDEWPIPAREIARDGGIPGKYLSSVLSTLVRGGVLRATRGKRGGFAMVRPPEATRLLEVLAPFEQFEARRCPFGNKQCSEIDPCLAHDRWKAVVDAFQQFLEHTTVQDVAIKREEEDLESSARLVAERAPRATEPGAGRA